MQVVIVWTVSSLIRVCLHRLFAHRLVIYESLVVLNLESFSEVAAYNVMVFQDLSPRHSGSFQLQGSLFLGLSGGSSRWCWGCSPCAVVIRRNKTVRNHRLTK